MFLKDDVCSWIIRNPTSMGPADWMWVEISYVDLADVFISKANNYNYKTRNAPKRAENTKVGILKGMDLIVVGVSTSIFPGTF